MQPTHSTLPATIAIYVVVIGLFVYRLSRAQRMSVWRLAVMPVFLVILTIVSIWGNAVASAEMGVAAASPVQVAVALIVGGLLGIPLGVLRGKHSDVQATNKRNVMYIKGSPLIVVVWLAAFILRSFVRMIVPTAGGVASAVSDGVLAFAVAALIVSYWIIYQRYRALAPAAPAV